MEAAARAGEPIAAVVLDCLGSEPDGLSGLAVAQRMEAHSLLQEVPRVLLNTHVELLPADTVQAAGIRWQLHKPPRRRVLRAALRDALGHEDGALVRPTPPPVRRAEQAAAMGKLEASGPDRALKVLVVEDEAVNQRVVVRMLSRLGMESALATNGEAALRQLQGDRFDAILMDCQMPVMDGYDASRAIRAREASQGGHIPIIGLTANAMPGDRERCLEAGMDDYITKPLAQRVLDETLARWLR